MSEPTPMTDPPVQGAVYAYNDLIRTGPLAPYERAVGLHQYATCDPRITDAQVNMLESIVGDPWGCGDYSLWQNALSAMADNRPAYWTKHGDEEYRAFARVANQLSLSVALSLINEKDRFTFLSNLVVLNLH